MAIFDLLAIRTAEFSYQVTIQDPTSDARTELRSLTQLAVDADEVEDGLGELPWAVMFLLN